VRWQGYTISQLQAGSFAVDVEAHMHFDPFGSRRVEQHAQSVNQLCRTRVADRSRAEGVEVHVRFDIDGEATGLQLRNCVAVPSNGAGATVEVAMSRSTLTAILAAKLMWSKADIVVHGDEAQVEVFRRCFDHAGMQG
ncbi:MAG: hypothetical protein ACKO2E_04020, partial [Actinomycetota bacterium]